MRKILITGASGMIGGALQTALSADSLDSDITDLDSVKKEIAEKNPLILIHCAAYTNVDDCERHPMMAHKVNTVGTANILKSFHTGHLIFFGSDHIFSGKRLSPHWRKPTETSKPDPVNLYGLTKMTSEALLLGARCQTVSLRTSTVYDNAYLEPYIDKLKKGEKVEFTNLIYRSFFYLPHLVESVMWVVQNIYKMPKILHVTTDNVMSYYQFWVALAKALGLDHKLLVPRKYKLKDATPRPFKGGLDISRLKKLGIPTYTIQDGINAFVEEYQNASD